MPTIAEDLSQPLPVYNTGKNGQSASTARFNPPGQSLLVAMVTVHNVAGTPSLSVSDTSGLTWTRKVAVGTNTYSSIWTAPVGSAPGAIKVTAVNSATQEGTLGLVVRVDTGVAAGQGSAAVASDLNVGNVTPQGAITPTARSSWVYCCAVVGGMELYARPVSLTTLTLENYQDTDEGSSLLFGRQVSPSGVLTPVTLGWTVSVPHTWSLVALEVLPADVPVSSSDSGSGSDSQAKVTVKVSAADTGTGTGQRNAPVGAGATAFLSSFDLGFGNDAIASVPLFWRDLGDTDGGTGTELGTGPALLYLQSKEFAAGSEVSGVPFTYTSISSIVLGFAQEGFSLDRCSVLTGGTGAEAEQLYAAQAISLVPDVSAYDMKSDDDEFGTWYMLNKAALTVVGGFMSFAAIAALNGTAVVSSGLSPADYYGLPLWAQYQQNQSAVPVAFRMSGRNTYGNVRTQVFVLYKVQLSALNFTGTVYKEGLGVSYSGTVLFSSTDEYGNTLSGPEIGRIVSLSGYKTGSLGLVPFAGV